MLKVSMIIVSILHSYAYVKPHKGVGRLQSPSRVQRRDKIELF